ncbi:CapA family protein [Legionella cardiaca]|uniref:CapA family protein n=1 Tax=Legionella cardiaca TaxID=1071983 RepID=A0ABY8ATK7_9GAMM|nr:CapA family protein [Legionella cardiaca]WED43104.1 CapA family protein [Legionella cardiaca]
MSKLLLLLNFYLFSPLFAAHVHIIAVGDILVHMPLQKKGFKTGFATLWLDVIPQLNQADITYGNLEGPAAGMITMCGNETKYHSLAYTAFPMFNYPPSLIGALKLSGFDILSTANNHSLDRWGIGIDKTIDALHTNAMAFTGTRLQNGKGAFFAETNAHGISIAWLACTKHTNDIADKHRQVLKCYRDKEELLHLISELAKTHDAVIVTPHWGEEYHERYNKDQERLAKEFAEAGALAILGSHPHWVQPFAWLTMPAGKKVFVAYSLGNFISNQGKLPNRASGLLSLYLKKQTDGRVIIEKVNYQPTYMENRGNQLQLTLVKSKKHPAYQLLKRIIGEEYLILPEKGNQ